MIWNLQQIYYLVHFHQVRKKLFNFSEIFRITGATPSQIISEEKSVVDPFYFLSQSGKGYNTLLEKTIKNYSQTQLTNVQKKAFGLDTSTFSFNHKIYEKPEQSYYFWHLYSASSHLKIIAKIPGVKGVYVFGSSLQCCANPTSDVDLAIHTAKNMAITARILVKLYLKIIHQDVYTFRFQINNKLFWMLSKINLITKLKYQQQIEKTRNEIWKYRNRAGLKIDAGMFFEDVAKLQNVFYKPNEHLFMYDIRLFSYYKHGKNLIPSLLPIPKNFKIERPNILEIIIHFILMPFARLYQFWQSKQNFNPNHSVSKNWVSFVPTMPEPEYLVSVDLK